MPEQLRVKPCVLPVGRPVTVTFEESDVLKHLRDRLRAKIRAKMNFDDAVETETKINAEGLIEVPVHCAAEGEFVVDLYCEETHLARANIYALENDLFALRPYRGDFHIHTHYSDGSSTPTFMAARGRRIGLDVIAITDHNRYVPSLEAREGIEKIGLDILAVPGEEVSVAMNGGHILSIAATRWIKDPAREREYEGRYDKVLAEVRKEMSDGEGALRYAHAKTITNMIHDAGGLAILAHPYWVAGGMFNLDQRVHEALLRNRDIDGIELFGDVEREDNRLSLARYYEYVEANGPMPLLGNSDTHREEHTYGTFSTLLFASELTKDAILAAIKELRTVVVEKLPVGGAETDPTGRGRLEVYGPTRLVMYGYFLLRNFFPVHDALAERIGYSAFARLEGRTSERFPLEEEINKMRALYQDVWAKA